MKNTLRKVFLVMILAIIATAAFAQADGPVNWVALADSPFGTTNINAVAWGDANYASGTGYVVNTWVVVGGNGKIAYWMDGKGWVAVPPGTGASQSSFSTGTNIVAVAYGSGVFIAYGGGRMAYWNASITWEQMPSPTSDPIYSIAYGGNRFVIGANNQTAYLTAIYLDRADGGWTVVDAANVFGTNNSGIYGIAYGNNRFVAVGSGGKIAYSTDGASWTAVANSPFDNRTTINAVAYGDGRFVAVGSGGKMAYCDW